MFHYYKIAVSLCFIDYFARAFSIKECSRNCTFRNGKLTTWDFNSTKARQGPPTMKFGKVRKDVTLRSTLSINCHVCRSSSPSSIKWFFNGKPLVLARKRTHSIRFLCEQTLYLFAVREEDHGNYTCIAKNDFGEANSTTEVAVIGHGCSKVCSMTKGKRLVGNKNIGPPKMKGKHRRLTEVSGSITTINCALCESNPPSTITWYYNDHVLNRGKNREKIHSELCEESLYFRVSKNSAGNYTCVAENSLGRASLTTEIEVYDLETEAPINISMEAIRGTIRKKNVKLGSTINITCVVHTSQCPHLRWKWEKNDKPMTGSRFINWQSPSNDLCSSTIIIHEVLTNSSGKYKCKFLGWIGDSRSTYTQKEISIAAVPCFRGFYCPSSNETAIRCPNGTFTMQVNAKKIEDCKSCADNWNETLTILLDNDEYGSSIRKINCPVRELTSGERSSGLLHGEMIAIVGTIVSGVVIIIIGGLYGMRRCRKYKKLVNPSEQIQIEIPENAPSRDVFVCYSSKNRDWVHNTLLANLREQHFQTFVDFVDFEIGVSIHENIVKGIYGSRKTIFVLSKDSIKSYYARSELSQALNAGRKTGRHQVIVVLYEKCKLPDEIANIVYLDWTAEEKRDQFWEKLYQAIRKS